LVSESGLYFTLAVGRGIYDDSGSVMPGGLYYAQWSLARRDMWRTLAQGGRCDVDEFPMGSLFEAYGAQALRLVNAQANQAQG
jgi:hypothetical protein